KTFGFFAICMLSIALADSTNSPPKNSYIALIYIVDTIAFMLAAYAIFYDQDDILSFYKKLVTLFMFVCVYGIFSYVSSSNPYISLYEHAYGIRNIAEDYLHDQYSMRGQTSSLFFHPYLYSVLLYFMLFYTLYFFKNKNVGISRPFLITLLVLILINIYLTDSRTIFVVTVLSLILYISIQLTAIKFIGYLLVLPFVLLSLNQIPQVDKITERTLDVFTTGGKKVEGSSLQMRQKQLIISLKYFADSPVFGNGFNFINTKLGFSVKIEDRTSDADAFGFESFAYVLLIEQGIIGIFAYLTVFISLFVYHLKSYLKCENEYRPLILINLIFVIGYLLFILGTGTINSLPFFFAFMGISLSLQNKVRTNPDVELT
ncbi:MAG: hypothetical protein JWO58_3242, partial [Chitinophagaceae bacterium]|nr:hypothetical protein [Chitinophagaceae bacterium]